MIAERIAEYMAEKGIQQKKLAAACGMAPQSMSQTLKGERTLTAEEYRQICLFLEVPYSRFMDEGKEE